MMSFSTHVHVSALHVVSSLCIFTQTIDVWQPCFKLIYFQRITQKQYCLSWRFPTRWVLVLYSGVWPKKVMMLYELSDAYTTSITVRTCERQHYRYTKCISINPNISRWVTSEKMAPKCDMVVKKRISSGLIYFYFTPHIRVVAF